MGDYRTYKYGARPLDDGIHQSIYGISSNPSSTQLPESDNALTHRNYQLSSAVLGVLGVRIPSELNATNGTKPKSIAQRFVRDMEYGRPDAPSTLSDPGRQ